MKDEDSGDEADNNEEKKSFDFNGMTIETSGNYSKCPKCEKNIKSTFIIRHIKLHDVPVEKYECPEKNCDLQVNRINNLFRHLKAVHRSKKPYMCKQRSCGARFARAQQLRQHLATHREERRLQRGGRAADGDNDDDDRDGARVYACEFPGCDKEYKKRHHLKEHERKHTGDQKYASLIRGMKFESRVVQMASEEGSAQQLRDQWRAVDAPENRSGLVCHSVVCSHGSDERISHAPNECI
jgi:hypothetical protein